MHVLRKKTMHSAHTPILFVLQLAVIVLCFTCFSCNSRKEEKKFTIGFSQCTLVNTWRKTMLENMQRELAFHPEINFIYTDANGNTHKQVEQIEELIRKKVDLLIVSPNEAAPITAVIEKASRQGIKTIVVDRKTLSDNYTAYVGASNYEVGVSGAAYANSLLKGKGNVLEISDIPGSSADIDRHKGFTDYIKQYPGIHYIAKIYEPGDEKPDDENAVRFLKNNPNIQLIFTQNDRLALAAYQTCKKLGLNNDVKIIGIDGLTGPNGGIDLVEKGIIKATILYPTGGEEAILTALHILNGETYKKENLLTTTIIDSSNVRIMKLQAEKVIAQQISIDKSQKKIEEQNIVTTNQSNIIYAISVSLALAIIFASVVFYYFQENKQINKRLALQNEEILSQRNQLEELGNKARQASEAKLNFFTNISHEFRTPLTLILGPVEELLANNRMHFKDRQYLSLIQKNVTRLLRLVNQLIDFRKIEYNKMKLSASENDIIQFTTEIADAFTEITKKRNIDLRVISKERSLHVWFDTSMLDKVLFNMLSNAMKFTRDDGFIHISIEKNIKENKAVIRVEDNGIGMSEEVAGHAFELFYQANITNQQGSGLGLALSKELITLHKGTITVRSKQGKGTLFEINLPLGKEHLAPDEICEDKGHNTNSQFDKKIYSTEADKIVSLTNKEETEQANIYEHSLLIIEDNPDLRNLLADLFSDEYTVMIADSGLTGLQQAFDNIPDLIISDVVLPGKDGFSIVSTLKNDIRTSHIPIVLLTAKTDIQQQITGMKNMADAYITKPFNVQFLKETIQSITRNREILREHYTSEVSAANTLQNPNKLDRKFINEFTSIVENNFASEDFNIDVLCKQMCISRVQLYRKVKALLDCNVNDYILSVRLQKSKYLLNQGELAIAEIAYKVGFASPAYFSTVFKSKFGVTPSNFKEKK